LVAVCASKIIVATCFKVFKTGFVVVM